MKFLISIPCQMIVVILVAVTISSVVSKPLQPLTAALSVSNSEDQPAATVQPQAITSFDYRPIFIALFAALGTFFLWHAYRFYRSESAIAQAQHVGARVSTANGLTGVMRYLFSDVKINLADKRISKRTMASLQQIHNLTSLNVSNCDLDRKMLFQFEYCRFLEELDVRKNPLSRDTLLAFRKKISAKLHHSC